MFGLALNIGHARHVPRILWSVILTIDETICLLSAVVFLENVKIDLRKGVRWS